MELDDPVATVLPKATGISWLFASWVKYILSQPSSKRYIALSFLLMFIIRGHAYGPIGRNSTSPWPILIAWPAPPRVFGC